MRGDAARRARGHAPGMPTACLLGGNNLIFQKTLIFRKSLQICGQGHGQGMHPRPRPRHAAKAKAAPYGHAAAKAKAAPYGHAAAKAKAAPMGRQRGPRHACLRACCQGQAKARSQGHGMLAWARWHAPGRRQQQGPSMPRGRGRGMPRGGDAKAVACPWDPYKAMAALGGAAAAKPR